jgi:hypothetical protein
MFIEAVAKLASRAKFDDATPKNEAFFGDPGFDVGSN